MTTEKMAIVVFTMTLCVSAATAFAEMPTITGRPVVVGPELLEWPYDRGTLTPNLNDPTSNTLHDFHADISSCELVLSTEGNYYPALRDVWPIFLAKFKDRPLQNWFYTTSPPIVLPQLDKNVIQFGNLSASCKPQVVVATDKIIKQLEAAGYTEGPAYGLYKDRGTVLLVKKGNPKKIQSVWDLGRDGVRYVSPNPALESGAFSNYVATIYGIAANDPNPPKGTAAENLIDTIFNRANHKWLAGPRIHHRDLPWAIAHGTADAAVIFYHLGLYITQTFPEKFDMVPLGGTNMDPQPFKGTEIGTRYVVRINGDWSPRQIEAREKLVQTLLSDDFTKILEKRGMLRPDGFRPVADEQLSNFRRE